MFFLIASVIIAISCSAITIKTLIGYSDIRLIWKLLVSVVIMLGWFAVPLVHLIDHLDILPENVYAISVKLLYILMGFSFILFTLLIIRDLIWYLMYGVAELAKKDAWWINPKNLVALDRANLITVVLSIVVSAYAVWEGYRLPQVKEVDLYSDKISQDMKIVQISDLHIDRTVSQEAVRKIVNQVNMLAPDVIVLTGDIIDDKIELIQPQLQELKELSAPYGKFSVMGNHEFYHDFYKSQKILNNLDLTFLFNSGQSINSSNVYIAGVPDMNTLYMALNLWNALQDSNDEQYKILLSHAPNIIDSFSEGLVDLVLSGHTHGGQIFPFHWLVLKANNYLAGRYTVHNTDLFVSRGAGTWGPAMRLLAPSDIAVINLKKK